MGEIGEIPSDHPEISSSSLLSFFFSSLLVYPREREKQSENETSPQARWIDSNE